MLLTLRHTNLFYKLIIPIYYLALDLILLWKAKGISCAPEIVAGVYSIQSLTAILYAWTSYHMSQQTSNRKPTSCRSKDVAPSCDPGILIYHQNNVLRLTYSLKRVNTAAASVPGSQASKLLARNELCAYCGYFGLPHLYLTLNPAPSHSPIFQVVFGYLQGSGTICCRYHFTYSRPSSYTF